MKYFKKLTLIPLVALVAAGCSGPTAIQSSTETDDLYYASTDKTVYASNTAAVSADRTAGRNNAASESDPDEVANPEYTATSRNNGSTYSDYEYYSDDYTYASRIRRFNSPYRGLSYYDFAYTDPYWYGSSFGGYNPFYDPFYPSGFYRPGFYSGLSLGMGFGNPYYSPFGYGGYGGFNRPFGGYYSGYQNGFYNGFYNGYYANRGYNDRYPTTYRPRNYGPRGERSVVPVNRDNTAGAGRLDTNTGGSRAVGGRPARNNDLGGGAIVPGGDFGGVKSPADAVSAQPQSRPVRGSRNTIATPDAGGSAANPNIGQPARTATDNNGYRPSTRPMRRPVETITTNESVPTPPSFPTETQRQSRPQRVIESRPRNIETPRYEAPRQQRSQEIYRPEPAPQRNDSWSQPSRSVPSSNDNGGNSGGGRPRARN